MFKDFDHTTKILCLALVVPLKNKAMPKRHFPFYEEIILI